MLDTSDDAIFTEEHARELMRRGACSNASKYIGKTIRECIDAVPWAALEFVLNLCSDEQFERAAKAEPWAALKFARKRLSDEQFERAAEADPQAALMYALDRLSEKQFERAAKAAPVVALMYAPDRARRMGLI